MEKLAKKSLYHPAFEKDSCGFGLIANMDGQASHRLVSTAIKALGRLTHRGAVAADGKTGDGCGLLLKMPISYMREKAEEARIDVGRCFAVGTVFLSRDPREAAQARSLLQSALAAQGVATAGWREVPINREPCGSKALESLPRIEQVFVNAAASTENFERTLFIARRRAEIEAAKGKIKLYITGLSSRTVIYKGLVMPENLPHFYEDLGEAKLESSICVFHQRFSTNTLPQWWLAQPFRFLAHNGEINTIQGNRSWANARAHQFKVPALPELAELSPLVSVEGSDSCSLDNMLEVLLAGGMDAFQAMRLLIPPAWQKARNPDPDLQAFYSYHSMSMEPWDGPVGIVLTDGRYAACILDRNGLRPARYVITRDRHITLASEIGVYDYTPEEVEDKGRVKPGEMLAVDTETGELLPSEAIDDRLKRRHPYRRWLAAGVCKLPAPGSVPPVLPKRKLAVYEKMFGVTFEEKDQVIQVLAEDAQEAVGSMGDDTPLPVMSRRPRLLTDTFRQQFAQVTNPPIDSLRESVVMSLETCFGPERSPFEETSENAKRIVVDSPVLSERAFYGLLEIADRGYRHRIFDLNIATDIDLQSGINDLCDKVVKAVKEEGVRFVVLSDRNIARDKIPIHALLACGAVHHRLVNEHVRCDANIIVETGFARDPHQFATLIGYGATAVFPYLSYSILAGLHRAGKAGEKVAPSVLSLNYRNGVDKGLYKIMSKMGISTITSYRGAQLFEIVGLHEEIVDLCFANTVSRIQGIRFPRLHDEQLRMAWQAWQPGTAPEQGGLLKYVHGGEYHAYNPDTVNFLHRAVRSGNYADYKLFADHVNQRQPIVLRDKFRLKCAPIPIALEEVEPPEDILPRFNSAGMSLGALSPDAHETLAQAMNCLGARSNSGEGGEDPGRYGTDKSSKIKQVASGRFGVTPHYLVNAEVLQIKIAQGAKPGEGGQLPGNKVNAMIAGLRYCNEGTTLISPPPHHDIYSIEDLAQLIFDLKQVNPDALVSVKLVSEAGVGTVAAGVAKAYADLITISGYDGGTGASALTSIKYAGTPWELGLSEANLVLRENGLRDKVRLQTDGGLKTGLDVVKAAILGAESFGFGTAPMIAMGCKYLRICHLNNCATGVATQNQTLRLHHFIGEKEMVMNYFGFVAAETREWMAKLGVRKISELIGCSSFLEVPEEKPDSRKSVDLTPILSSLADPAHPHRFCAHERNMPFDKAELAEKMLADSRRAIENKSGGTFAYSINNTHRSIGALLSGEIARVHGNYGMEDAPVTIELTGTAGQSLGAWNAGGLRLHLEGDANDYVGKGMAGGEIVLRPPKSATTVSHRTPIVGNTCLYGATGGKFFAAGLAGERFAVRNSGVVAVVEGVGDHGCEYMTGGTVIVLGDTGMNFGAGMSGGLALVFDERRRFHDCYNDALVGIQRMDDSHMQQQQDYLLALLEEYVGKTESPRGRKIIDRFAECLPLFYLVKPHGVELSALTSTMHKVV